MAFTRAIKNRSLPPVGSDSSGIALFIVLAAVSVLTILVTEFTYISQITQAVAFGSLDQVKAHYLAKSALKLSLLRLKAYKNVKLLASSFGPGAAGVIPKNMIDQIWSFPFSYPIPSGIPGLSQTDKDAIDKFQKNSGFEGGSYQTRIESESSKYNLNLLLANYVPIPAISKAPPLVPVSPPVGGVATPSPSPSPTTPFSPDAAREGLYNYLNTILNAKILADPEFSDNRRNFRLNDLVENISTWVDRKFEGHSSRRSDNKIPFKKAPFYTLSELHMIPGMDDELFQLFSPALTTSTTQGINVNTMQEPVLRALIPRITPEEVTDFFKFRDATETDNKFKSDEDFFGYLQRGMVSFLNNPQAITDFKASLTKQNIQIVFEETQFKITIEAKVNNSFKTIEAWVDLSSENSKKAATGGFADGNTQPLPPGGRVVPDPGLKITFMKIM